MNWHSHGRGGLSSRSEMKSAVDGMRGAIRLDSYRENRDFQGSGQREGVISHF